MSAITNSIFSNTPSSILSSNEKNQKDIEYDIRKNGFDSKKDYGMQTREEHLKLLEYVIKKTNFFISRPSSKEVLQFFEYIEKHELFNDVELATIVGNTTPHLLLETISLFRITEESDRYKLFELIVKSSNQKKVLTSQVISNFSKFNIITPSFIKNFINVLLDKKLQDKKLVEDLFNFFLLRFQFFSEEDKYEIGKHLTQLDPHTANKYFERVTFNDPLCLKNWLVLFISMSMFGLEKKPYIVILSSRIIDYLNKITDPLNKYEIAKLTLIDLITKIDCKKLKETLKSFIDKNEKYRNKEIQTELSVHFLSELCLGIQYLKNYQNLITNSEKEVVPHLLLPAVVMASWIDLDDELKLAQKFIELLSMREIKLNLKSSTGVMQILLKTFLIMKKRGLTRISNFEKLNCIFKAMDSSIHQNEEKKFNGNRCKEFLHVLYSSFTQPNLFKNILVKLPEDYGFEDFVTEFTKKVEDIFALEEPIDNFIDKYNEFEKNMRIPGTCVMYIGNLQNLQDPLLIKDIQKLVYTMLHNQVPVERYSTVGNPHLDTIKKEFPSIFSKWQVSLEPKELQIDGKKPLVVVDTDDPQDLFLCGTEVDGSCQRIDGDSNVNKGLIAYILDGKNRLVAVKDKESGKIQSRCLLRLLLDEKTREPVLFQDRIYPDSSPYTDELNDIAKTKAQDLQVTLYSCNNASSQDGRRALTSLGNSLAYEYVDAAAGNINNGRFTISANKIL